MSNCISIEKIENGYLVIVPYDKKYTFKDFQGLVEFIAHEFTYLKIGEEFEHFKVIS